MISVGPIHDDWTYKEDKGLFTGGCGLHGMVSETHADEDDGEDRESHELDVSMIMHIRVHDIPGLASFPSCR